MAKNRPVGRIMHRADKGEPWVQIGTLWSSPFDGTFGLSLGNRAFKDSPEVSVEEALDYLNDGGFTNVWMNRERESQADPRSRGDGDDFGDFA